MLRVARNDAERNNIAFKTLDFVRQYALKIFQTAESGVDKVVSSCEKNPSVHWKYMNFLRQRKTALDAPLYAVSAGRSMIEMLGVLAIIGVLSVGGIAGYSKAMEKFKVNKAIEEYSYAITGLLEYKDNILKQSPENQYFISDLVLAMQLVPDTWQMGDFLGYGTQKNLQDSFGNGIYFFTMKKELAMHIYMNQANNNIQLNWCQILMENVIKPLHSMIIKGGIAWNGSWKFVYSGDKYCSEDTNCLRDITLAQISEQCKNCMEKSGACMVGLNF